MSHVRLVHPTPTSPFVFSKRTAMQVQMVARNRVRVVTPSFVYRRGGVLTTLKAIQPD